MTNPGGTASPSFADTWIFELAASSVDLSYRALLSSSGNFSGNYTIEIVNTKTAATIMSLTDQATSGFQNLNFTGTAGGLIEITYVGASSGTAAAGTTSVFDGYFLNTRFNFTEGAIAQVPVPATILLFGLGIAGLGVVWLKRAS